MRLRFNPKLYSALAVMAAALMYGIWVEPLALSQEDSAEPTAPAEGSDQEEAPTPEESVVVRDGASASEETTKPSEEKEDFEVIDLNESLDEQVEKWDSAKARYNPHATPVTIENIVEPTGEYRYASFGKPNPFMPPLKFTEDSLGVDGDMSPASDLATAAITSAVNIPTVTAPATDKAGVSASGKPHEIPVVSTLQKYPLGNLELKGVWQLDTGEKRAIVMTPNKEGIIVKVSDPISAGKILEINRDHLVVRQYRLREDGVREFSDHNLYLGDATRREKTFVRLIPGKDPEFTPEPASKETLTSPAAGTVKPDAPKNTVPPPTTPVVAAPTPQVTTPTAVNVPTGGATPATAAPTNAAPAGVNNGPLIQAVPAPFGTTAPTTPASTTGSSQP